MSRREKKVLYEKKICDMLENYDRAFLVGADNVGSKQFQDIRRALRPDSVILMGKNTLMKRCIRIYMENTGDQRWACVLPLLVLNVGLVFTKGDLGDLRAEIAKYKVPAPARVGGHVQTDVFIDAGMTSMDPSQTSFFQALNISTKINKGNIEILSRVHLLKEGEKVSASAAALLGKLGQKPFEYGLEIQQVIESGSVFDVKVLSITDDDLVKSVGAAVANVASVSLALGIPTLASVPHSVINGYKNVLSVALALENYSFPLADKVKDMIANPDAYASAAPAAGGGGGAAAPAAAPAPVEESEEEDEAFDLFD